MHPILKNLRSVREDSEPKAGCGIVSTGDLETNLRCKQREDRTDKAAFPAVDLVHDSEPRMEEERDLMLNASKVVKLSPSVMEPEDFEPDDMGSVAMRQMEASKLVRNGEHTRSVEKWQHDTFVSHVRQLVERPSTCMGMLYLSDFLDTLINSKPDHALTMQLVTILGHCQEPALSRLLKDITIKKSDGTLQQQWLVDLITVLEAVFRGEHGTNRRVTAILTIVNELALSFAKKACGGVFPTTDKLSKTLTFFRRMVIGTLDVAESIGSYTFNTVSRRPEKRVKLDPEQTDASYLLSLKGALECPESDEEDEDE